MAGSRRRDILVPASRGPLASVTLAELGLLDAGLDSVDSMSEAESGRHASPATLKAGQAAVRRLNARRGKS